MAILARDLESDAVLVTAAQSGDSDAFAELFRRHHAAVRRTCVRRLGDVRAAEEVAQSAFVRAWERIDRCGGPRRFGGWVQVIAHHLCIDLLRERARTSPAGLEPDQDGRDLPGEEPETMLLRSEQANLVKLALADLPPRQRDVVVARDLEDRRPTEIAAALGLSVGAVDSLLLRGRRRLASSFERLTSEGGSVSASTTTSVAAGVAAGSGRFTSVLQSIQDAVAQLSYQIASALGLVPGVAGPAERAAAAALLGGAVATGGAISGGPTAAPPAPAPTAITVPAPAIDTPKVAVPAAPEVHAPTVPVIPAAPELAPVVADATDAVAPQPAAPAVDLVDNALATADELVRRVGDLIRP